MGAVPAPVATLRLSRWSDAIWASLDLLAYPSLLLAATPLLVQALGVNGFGVWSFYLAIVALGGAASAGTATAVSTVVATVASTGGPGAIAGPFREGLRLAIVGFGAIALVFALVGVLLAPWLGRVAGPTTVTTVCICGLIVAWIEHIDQIYSAVWKGFEAFALAALTEVALRAGQLLAVLAGVWAGAGLIELITIHGLSSTVRLLVKRSRVLGQYPALRGAGAETSVAAGTVRRRALWGWLQGVGGVAFGTADRLVVGIVLGPVALAQYAIVVQLGAQLHAVAAAATSILAPAVSRVVATSVDLEALIRRLARLTLAITSVAALGYAAIALLAPFLLQGWLGGEAVADSSYLLPLMLGFALLTINVVPFHALAGLGRMREAAIVCVIAGALTASVALLCVPVSGLDGAAWSRLIYAVVTLALLPLAARALGRPLVHGGPVK